jgi:hypothetical protein
LHKCNTRQLHAQMPCSTQGIMAICKEQEHPVATKCIDMVLLRCNFLEMLLLEHCACCAGRPTPTPSSIRQCDCRQCWQLLHVSPQRVRGATGGLHAPTCAGLGSQQVGCMHQPGAGVSFHGQQRGCVTWKISGHNLDGSCEGSGGGTTRLPPHTPLERPTALMPGRIGPPLTVPRSFPVTGFRF